jgi:hypothetical protein
MKTKINLLTLKGFLMLMFTILLNLSAISQASALTVISPNGGENWLQGSTCTISWNYDNPAASYVYLEFSADNGQTWNFITYSNVTGNEGSYEWITPELTSEQCLIRIRDYYLAFVSDTSSLFTILTYPETPICMVSVDSTTSHNVIVWEKPVSDLIDKFVIYKESNEANVYEILGMVNYTDEAIIADTSSNPNMKS